MNPSPSVNSRTSPSVTGAGMTSSRQGERMKLAFKLAGFAAAALFVIAALSSAREWFILYHFDGYQPMDFVIGHARREVNDETECILAGSAGGQEVEFHISPAR